MGLYDRFELLEMRRDDGIQTFHAREIATARPVQVHLLLRGEPAEHQALLSRLDHLPDAERRRIIDRGEWEGMRYVVTDRLAGYPGFREWVLTKSDPAARISALDEQFRDLFENAETAPDISLRTARREGPRARQQPDQRPDFPTAPPAFAGPAAYSRAAALPAPVLGQPASPEPVLQEPTLLDASTDIASPDRNVPEGIAHSAILRGPASHREIPHPEISAAPPAADNGMSGTAQTTTQTTARRRLPPTKALLAIAIGILAAIVLLAVIVAAIAFRPR